jgi:hypothetical protein
MAVLVAVDKAACCIDGNMLEPDLASRQRRRGWPVLVVPVLVVAPSASDLMRAEDGDRGAENEGQARRYAPALEA